MNRGTYEKLPREQASCLRCGQSFVRADRKNKTAMCSACFRYRYHVKCQECNVERWSQHRTKYCSPICAGRARRKPPEEVRATKVANWRKWDLIYKAKKHGATIEVFSPLEIFARDGWKCQRCGRKIKVGAKDNGRKASIDHIIPLSKGGAHSRRNVQATCLSCNVRKKNCIGGDQLLPIA